MENFISFMEQYSHYFSIMVVALLSFFISLPRDLNPLAAIEIIFQQIANKVNLKQRSDNYKRLASLLSISLIYLPTVVIISQLYNIVARPEAIDALMLFILLSWHDKKIIYQQIIRALKHNNLAQAKFRLDSMTQRETKPLSLMGINKATIESMLLQLSAAWFAVLFWYLATGIYGALLYRCIQLCAQQWNAKHSTFNALTTIPTLLYSLLLFPVHILMSATFALYDRPLDNLIKKCKQSLLWHHFSSGLMLSSFALGMQFQLGGVRMYEQQKVSYASLGNDIAPTTSQVDLSLQRVSLSAWFWLCCYSGYTFMPLMVEFISF